jgi:hypothetical protein
MIGNPLSQPIHNLFLGSRRSLDAFLGNNIGAGYFSSLIFVVDADDGDIIDVRVGGEDAFEFGGWNLEAFVFDEFFDAVGDVEISVCILVAYVAGLYNESKLVISCLTAVSGAM